MDLKEIKRKYQIIGKSPLLDKALYVALRAATTDLPVLVVGESGVGKEVFPKIIHDLSSRKNQKYIPVNCGAIPQGTIDSELFGHKKGSFTGADKDRLGYFEVADGGTIFLDEVAELPLATQVRLLRVLQTGEFFRVGDSEPRKTDVRVVAATNVKVAQAVAMGKFRLDLYYRINAIPISVPALRERKDDIVLMFKRFAFDFADTYHFPEIKLSASAETLIREYGWPGNVRQLKNVAEQLSVLENEREVSADTIAAYLPKDSSDRLPVLFNGSQDNGMANGDKAMLLNMYLNLKQEVDELRAKVDALSNSNVQQPRLLQGASSATINTPITNKLDDNLVEDRFVETEEHNYSTYEEPVSKDPYCEDVEVVAEASNEEDKNLSIKKSAKSLIQEAVNKYPTNKEAAAELGISERTLYRKMKTDNIKRERKKS